MRGASDHTRRPRPFAAAGKKPDLYRMLLKFFNVVDCCGCDEGLLVCVGIDGIVNGTLADAVEGIGVHEGDIKGTLRLLEGSRAVDCNGELALICYVDF